MKKIVHKLLLTLGLVFGAWGLSSAQSIDSAEYFYDIDPGVGNATPFTIVSGDTTLDSVYTNTTGLATGFHNLYMRVKDSNNVWSLYEGGKFYIYDTIAQAIPASYPIAAAEYFFDTDPGIDSGIAITSFTAADTVLLMDTLPSAPLTAGTHYLYVRVKDSMNIWSLCERQSFVICNFIPAADFTADTVCLYDSTTFTDLTTNLDTSAAFTYTWDFNNDHIIDDTTKGNTTHLFTTAGTHTVSLVVNNTNGCTDTVMKVVYIDSLPVLTFALPVDTICKADTLHLSGGSPAGGFYSGTGVYGSTFYGDSVTSGNHVIWYTYYNSDSCMAKISDNLFVSHCTGIQEYASPGLMVTITPNPFNITTSISLHSSRPIINARLILFDVFGKEIRDQKLESGTSRLERGTLTAGVYFYKVLTAEGSFATGKLVVVD